MKAYNLKVRILVPLALIMATVLSLFVFGIYYDEQEHLADDLKRSINSIEGHYQATLKEREHKLGSVLDVITANSKFSTALEKRDREKLLELSKPFFKKLKNSHNITHFYFHDSQRINILRVHQPARYGDIIGRFTALEAEKTKKFFSGTELGPLGTFTFRAVLPIWRKDKLLGYVELGEEIDPVIQDMQRIFKVSLLVVIEKSFLHQPDWASGMKLLGRKADWNHLTNQVVVSKTLNELPKSLNDILLQQKKSLFSNNIKLEQGEQSFWGRILPLKDASQRTVGGMVLLRDMSQRIQSTREMITTIASSSLLMSVLIFIFFYFTLGRTERQLTTSIHNLQKSKEQLSHAQHIAHMGSWESDIKSDEFVWSDEMYNIFEISQPDSSASYKSFIDAVHPDDRDRVKIYMESSRESDKPYDITYRTLMPDGRIKYLRDICDFTYDSAGNITHTTKIVHDITELRQAAMLSERMGNLFENSWNEIYTFNTDSLKFVDVSKGALQNLGYTIEELQQMTPVDIKPEVSGDQFYTLIEPLYNDDVKQVDFETLHQRKDGTCYPVEVRLQISTEELPSIFTAIIQDISERKKYIEELEHKTLHDALTDLPNHSLLQDRLQHALKIARRETSTLAVLNLDIVRLREINDVMGHQNGDIVLKETALRLRKVLREVDTVARLSGVGFSIIMPGINIENVNIAVDKVQRLFKEPVIIEEIPLEMEVAIGVAFYPLHGEEPEALIRHADIAANVAKSNVNGFCIYDPEDDPYSLEQLKLFGELRSAISNKEMMLYYQPKIDIKTGKIKSVEALARWSHPVEGMISPEKFIPMVEQTGMIRPFTLWVLEEAIIQIKSWAQSGIELSVAVNLSTRNLLDPSLPDYIQSLLESHQVSAKSLSLEITESAIMYRPESAIALLERLHDMGFSLSIDDFGTGYSSLAYLKKLPVDEIKIDQSFVYGLITNEDDAVIVHSTIELAHNLGLTVVAEGVENQEVHDMLKTLGCDISQGYYFTRPIANTELSLWLSESPWGLM